MGDCARLGGGFVRSGSGIPSVESKQPAAKKRPKPSEASEPQLHVGMWHGADAAQQEKSL